MSKEGQFLAEYRTSDILRGPQEEKLNKKGEKFTKPIGMTGELVISLRCGFQALREVQVRVTLEKFPAE